MRSIAFLSSTKGPGVPVQVGMGFTWQDVLNGGGYTPDTSTRPRVVSGQPIRILGSNGEWVTPMGEGDGPAGIWNQLLSQGVNAGSQVAAAYLQSRAQPGGQYVNGQYVSDPNALQFGIGGGGVSGLASLTPGMIAAGLGAVLLVVVVSSISVSKRK